MFRVHVIRAAAVMVLGLGLSAGAAYAHLALVRQGGETRGARESGDRFGAAIALGDFDGNGYNDLAVGSPSEGLGPQNQGQQLHGAVTVNYSNIHGVSHSSPELLQPSELSLYDTNQRFGTAIAAADFNGDTYDDLAVASPWINAANGTSDVGAVYIYYGSDDGLSTSYGVELTGDLSTSEQFGRAVVAGDFNDDGYGDLAIGAPGADYTYGKVFAFYGSSSGPTMSDPRNHEYVQDDWVVSPALYSGFGTVLAAGHFIGDAADDLIVGIPLVSVYPNGRGLIGIAEGDVGGVLEQDPTETRSAASFGGNLSTNHLFGYAIAIGQFTDVPGGYGTVAIGAPGAIVGGAGDVGRVFVVEGSAAALVGDVTILDQSDAVCANGSCSPEGGDFFGAALAAGRMTEGSYDDLAIASTGEDVWDEGTLYADAGIVNVLYGSAGDLGDAGGRHFFSGNLDYATFSNARIGETLAFGRTDWNATGRQSLLIGTPALGNSSGGVYVVAPWRQMYDYDAKGAITRDCEGSIIYSRRAFDELQVASTTKAMTALLACEAIQAGSPDSNLVYTVPEWVQANVPGSTANLLFGEQDRLIDLVRMAMTVSGNDASYAVADALTGANATWNGLYDTVNDFVDDMNARAAELGMNHTLFTNPSGFDDQGNETVLSYSTAYDMSTLGRAAMQNALVRKIVSADRWTVNRTFDGTTVPFVFQNGFTQGVKQAFVTGSGVKGGWTPLAGNTGIFSGADNAGQVVAVTLGTPQGKPFFTPAGGLLSIGQSQCQDSTPFNPGDFAVEQPVFPALPFLTLSQIPAEPGSPIGGSTDFTTEPGNEEPITLELYPTSQSAMYDVEVRVVSELELPENGQSVLGVKNANAWAEGVEIINRSEDWIAIEVLLEPGGESFVGELPPCCGQGWSGSWFNFSTQHTIRIINRTSGPVSLDVIEKGYQYDTLGNLAIGLVRDDVPPKRSTLEVLVDGASPGSSDTAYLVVRGVNGLVDVADGTAPTVAPKGLEVAAWPSPFRTRTNLVFDPGTSGAAEVFVYDVNGRLVRHLDSPAQSAGVREVGWDGRSLQGAAAPDGVYYLDVRVDGRTAARGRVVRLR